MPKRSPRPRWRERSRLVRLWRLARTRRPRTFTEKVRYKMLRDHRPLVVTFADKVAVRDHVTAVVGPGHLPALIAVCDDPADLAAVDLPESYVVKPSHGSGAVVVVSPQAPADARLPVAHHSWVYRHVRPEHADRRHLVAIARHWTSQLYGQGPNREWAYGHVPRRVVVEELLQAPGGAVPDDLKLFVVHGRCHWVQVDSGRFGHRTQDFHRPDWEHLPLSGGPPWADPPHPRPERLEEAIALAEQLGEGTDFVRVDLYVLPDRVVVGELTNYPAGGDSPFHPEHWDAIFGEPWSVPRRYR
ncbi:ATP-grasp fold amidoligase family protein [Kineococcus endophyticus]|uniref:ATP-grasp fold amidoligase family protein n=1 Tax=Kineococcus endophyticus TaxID=1181883 RepID=A0ABV3P3P6_9ACTN